MNQYHHIEGLSGREPVGAILRIGRKSASGRPVDNDQFYLCQTTPEWGAHGDRRFQFRALHPDFVDWNSQPPVERRVIRGNLVHASRHDSFHHYLRAQVLSPNDPVPSNGAPACHGDGLQATRFRGTDDDGNDVFESISCPNALCEFRQEGNRKCAPFGRLYFRPRWAPGSHWPTPLVKLVTRSWNTVRNILGCFEYIHDQGVQLGLPGESVTLYGIPFALHLTRKSAKEGRAFPVVTMTPETDLIAFFGRQRDALDRAGAIPLQGQIVGARDDVERQEPQQAEDYADIVTTPMLPGFDTRTEGDAE